MAKKAKPADDTSQAEHSLQSLKNIGPACERDLNAAGIHTIDELKRLGAEDAFVKLLLSRRERGASVACCNAAYLYALYGAIHDLDWRELPESKKKQFKEFTAELRESGFGKS